MTVTKDALPRVEAAGLVGITEIAERLTVQRATVDKWRTRGLLPPADFDLVAGPVWWWTNVVEWARRTGRL